MLHAGAFSHAPGFYPVCCFVIGLYRKSLDEMRKGLGDFGVQIIKNDKDAPEKSASKHAVSRKIVHASRYCWNEKTGMVC